MDGGSSSRSSLVLEAEEEVTDNLSQRLADEPAHTLMATKTENQDVCDSV